MPIDKNKNLYIANTWKSLITKTAYQYFAHKGWTIDGNWLNNENVLKKHNRIIAVPAFFDNAIIINPSSYPFSNIYTYLLYPDETVGWNFKTNNYKKIVFKEFVPMLKECPILSHSQFTLKLVASIYKDSLNTDRKICYLPIEFSQIYSLNNKLRNKTRNKIRVLWNHMWRSDKGFLEALKIIEKLSNNYSNIEFIIGRKNKWGSNPDVYKLKIQTKELLIRLAHRNNVSFQENFKTEEITQYWHFLTTFDIGFSTSYQEGFGLSMLEQAAAGIACVLPRRECYSEIHNGSLITNNIEAGLSELIENTKKRKEIMQGGLENAAKYNAEDWAGRILKIINE